MNEEKLRKKFFIMGGNERMFVKKRRLTLITLLVLSIIMCISGVANTARQPVDTSSFTPEQLEAYNRFIAQPP